MIRENGLNWGALHEAVLSLDREHCLRLICATPACVHDRATDGDTPLHLAAHLGRVELCEALLAHGANVHAVNVFGMTPLHLAASAGEIKTCATLLRYGADPELAAEDGATALSEARAIGHGAISAMLSGARTNSVNHEPRYRATQPRSNPE